MAPVGSFLLYWSMLEQELNADIAQRQKALGEASCQILGVLRVRLDAWVELVQREGVADWVKTANVVATSADKLRRHRNLIVHGLCGAHANGPDYVPYLVCRPGGFAALRGKERRYGLDELEDLTQAIDRCRRAFIHIPNWGDAPVYSPARITTI
jgi:hypothetical protein